MSVRVQFGSSVLVGKYGGSTFNNVEEWRTAGWYGPAATGYDATLEFFLDCGIIIDLPVNQLGPVGWHEIVESA
jgi:hypothetical protein